MIPDPYGTCLKIVYGILVLKDVVWYVGQRSGELGLGDFGIAIYGQV